MEVRVIMLYFGSIGLNGGISESSYKPMKGQLYKGMIGKCPYYFLFPVIPL